MFCPSCGTEYTIGLPYCNRCGANLNTSLTEPAEVISVNLTKAIAAISTTIAVLTLGGFITLVVGAAKLAERAALGTDPIIAMMVLGMVTILTIDILLGRQLSRLIEAGISSKKSPQRQRPLPSANVPPELARPVPSPALSVTENTTRFLEPEYRGPSKS
jgi:hypothetical protein